MTKEHRKRDVIVIGAGMAGLTAALYAGRSGLSVLVLESELVGGQIANAAGIENYPGIPGVGGGELSSAVQTQAESFGAVVDEFGVIVRVELSKQPKIVETESAVYEAGAVILGKCNLSEFAYWMSEDGMPSGYSSLSGQVVHPYNPAYDPSGSSSGSARFHQ